MFNLEKFLNDLKDEQIKKLEALNQKVDMNLDPNKNQDKNKDANKDANEKATATATSTPKTVLYSSSFKFPISYLENKQKINDNIINDLELVESKDPEGMSMYSHIFKPESIFSKKYLNEWSKYYTTDTLFLKDSQVFYKLYNNQYGGDLKAAVTIKSSDNSELIVDPHDIFDKIDKLWIDIAGDKNFKQRFNYIEFPILDRLNKSPGFLQLLSLYNLTSPVISLLSPIILLIIPFFLLKFQRVDVTVSGYIGTLKKIFATHPIGKMFSLFDVASMSWDKRVYVIMSLVFYVIQVYQNIMSCYQFYKNMILIHKNIFILRDYFRYTTKNMKHIISIASGLETYGNFVEDLNNNMERLEKLCKVFDRIKPFRISLGKILDIGKIMKINYEIFVDHDIKTCVDYSFGFNAFYEQVDHLKTIINLGKINPCSFIDSGKVLEEEEPEAEEEEPEAEEETEGEKCKEGDATDAGDSEKCKNNKSKKEKKNKSNKSNKSTTSSSSVKSKDTEYSNTDKKVNTYTKFKNLYYPPHENPVKNSVTINKKIIITGPNAAGKTTVIKSTLMNIILSQQIGYGFYEKAEIKPYDYLHCYLNIPDTSGRDSLFQAESRRCKEILDCLEENKDKTHFCIFDELYSGTNPYEAVASAYGYIDYLSLKKNVDLMLTTHYIELCNNFKSNKKVKNYHMSVNVVTDNSVEYLYKFKKGISNIKGGIKVLYDLEYPEIIINNTKHILSLL
jgi:energy-coupling factor transporter ATP-binding protein EcfA2